MPNLVSRMVVDHAQLAGLFVGSPENALDQASDLSRTLHITYKERPFHTVLSCAPLMYDELWVEANACTSSALCGCSDGRSDHLMHHRRDSINPMAHSSEEDNAIAGTTS